MRHEWRCPETRKRMTIRPASVADSEEITRVCLLTAYQGRSAEKLVRHPELPSEVRALPYIHLASGFGFVLVETSEQQSDPADSEKEAVSETKAEELRRGINGGTNNIVGYVVGTGEAAQFEREVDATWWPDLRIKYPQDLVGTPLDRYFVGLIHKGTRLGRSLAC